jgi:ribosome-associated protein
VNSFSKTLAVAEAALEKKAYDLVVLQVEHLNSIADCFVIASGRSDTQVKAIAEGIEARLAKEGVHPLGVEGVDHAHWVVLDYDDIVIHIFFEPSRDFYRLEENWIDAEPLALPEPLGSQARSLSLKGPDRVSQPASLQR